MGLFRQKWKRKERPKQEEPKELVAVLKYSSDARHLLPHLKSCKSPQERLKIINSADELTFQFIDTVEEAEETLEKWGLSDAAQEMRWKLFNTRYYNKQSLKWCQSVIEIDIEGRWILQREIYVREELAALRKAQKLSFSFSSSSSSSSSSSKSHEGEISGFENELAVLNQQYFDCRRRLWNVEGNTPQGPLGRAFTATRKRSDWFLFNWLMTDCARRGGCCGRECGCCTEYRRTKREHHRGHCTSGCGCCIRSKGIDPGRFIDLEDYPFDIVALKKSEYSRRVQRAYIFNLEF